MPVRREVVAVVGGVADDGVVAHTEALQGFRQPRHLGVEAGAAGVVVGDLAARDVRHAERHVGGQVDCCGVVDRVLGEVLGVGPVGWTPGQEQGERIVRACLPMAFDGASGEVGLTGGTRGGEGKGAVLVLVVAALKVAPGKLLPAR